MKTITLTVLLALILSGFSLSAQKNNSSQQYGHTLNLGVGIGYYGYYHHAGRTLPVLDLNYEFDVARNFTLAPFVSLYSYREDEKHYRESIIP